MIIRAALKRTVDKLSDDDLVAFNLVLAYPQFDWTRAPYYPTIQHLFTKQDGKAMHNETKKVLKQVVSQALRGRGI